MVSTHGARWGRENIEVRMVGTQDARWGKFVIEVEMLGLRGKVHNISRWG